MAAVEAITRKPGGGDMTESPWLIQTVCSGSRPSKSAESVARRAVARPNSRPSALATCPPAVRAIHCMP